MSRWVFDGVEYETRSLMCEARRERYVELIHDGMNYTQAAKTVGVSKRTGKVWRNGRTRSTGRNEKPSVTIWYRPDMDESKTINPRFLDLESRLHIADWIRAGWSIRRIADKLGRAASSVSREIARNANPDTGMYEPNRAQRVAAERLARPKTAKVRSVPGLLDYVRGGLKRHWSPEQIAGRLREDFPDNEGMRICTETIHQAIYVQAKGELRKDASKALRSGRAARRPRTDGNERRCVLASWCPLCERCFSAV